MRQNVAALQKAAARCYSISCGQLNSSAEVNTLRQSEELRRTCPVLLETCSSEVLRSKAFCHLDSYRDGDEEDEE